MKKSIKIIGTIFRIILIVIIVINLISIISLRLTDKGYPDIFGYSYFSVLSGSMEPTIKVGDEIIIKITDDVKENDIITFHEEDSFVTHRLLRIEGNNLITKGDANDSEDDPVSKERLVGKVILTIPFLGKIKFVITNTYFLIVLVLAYIINEFIINKKEKEAKE